MSSVVQDDEFQALDAWWRAANYLTVGQIYLQENALLREPLRREHIKPRLLGHWGTSPGLNFIYAHLNRLIRRHDLDVLYLAGPGHGGPAIVANVYLEGTYSEIYPAITQDEAGLRALFRQFSTPGGIPSHVSVTTPGSIHEGGELGYVLMHAFGAVFDQPDLLAVAIIGDGEAETAPLEGSWKGIRFLNPRRDGAVLPILHLNGYKIAGPTVWGRARDEEVASFLRGHGYQPFFVEGDDPARLHCEFAATLERAWALIHANQRAARVTGQLNGDWPAIVLRTPKGWTGPREVDGVQIEGTFRAHQVPLARVREEPAHLGLLEQWMRSYRPEELFDASGRLRPEIAAEAPIAQRRMGANPVANGGRLTRPLDLPPVTDHTLQLSGPGRDLRESTRELGSYLREVFRRNAPQANFRLFCPDEVNSNRLGAVFEATDRCLVRGARPDDDHVTADGRVMEVLSEHNCQGWLEGYVLTGRHGLFATYEAFATIVDSMATQHAKWLEHAAALPWRAPVPALNYLLTSTCWRNDHNGFSHQGPGFIDTLVSKKGAVVRVYLPPDANCLLHVASHCLESRSYLNLIVIDKQPQLQWLDSAAARAHCAAGASRWAWCSNDAAEPDLVLACAGDIPTLEIVAAAWLLRQHAPELKVRVVNVVDLMSLSSSTRHPHGLSAGRFLDLFTDAAPVVFAFHGYPGIIHQLLHGRPHPDRFHVRGYDEEGTTTTPFDMVVLNRISRYHLCLAALKFAPRRPAGAAALEDLAEAMLRKHRAQVREHFEDLPEIRDWTWSD